MNPLINKPKTPDIKGMYQEFSKNPVEMLIKSKFNIPKEIGNNPQARGRRGNVRRDSMGRYSRDGGYSYDEAMDEMAAAIREGMGDMPENLKMDAQRFLNKIEQNM